ncbi:ATP-binding protein [Gottschalkiaceae bacterium SANA]|nr:ATP-binding protein [Gottschalkiaceae bacterium SANA]
MTALNQILQSGIGTISNQGAMQRKSQTQYKCPYCNDSGWEIVIKDDGREVCRPCECLKRKKAISALKDSGIAEAFQDRTLDNYIPKNEVQEVALSRSKRFVEIFGEYDNMHMNFMLMGQNGAGKTHLSIGIANALIKKNVLVRYVTFQDLLATFANAKKEKDLYKVINQYKDAELLVIDDIFRTTIREWNGQKNPLMSHIDSMFQIIDYRYFKKKGIVVTCEKTIEELRNMDRAITGRLVEYARGNIVEFKDPKLDHRFYGR